MGFGITLSAGGAGGSGIQKVADAAALAALTPANGDFAIQIDTDELWYYDGAAWQLWAVITDHADLVQVIADLAAHIADATDAHDASAISFVAGGTIAATDVQTAISEVATDAATDLSNHLTDAVDAHDASAISFAPAGTIAATDAQAAIEEVSGDIEAHLVDATAAHAASAVSFTPTGTIAATDTQAAVAEVSGDVESIKMVVVANSAQNNGATFAPANNRRQIQQLSGNAAAVTLTDLGVATAVEGDELHLLGTDDTNTVTLVSATNTVLNGSMTLANDSLLSLIFANGKWREIGRNN